MTRFTAALAACALLAGCSAARPHSGAPSPTVAAPTTTAGEPAAALRAAFDALLAARTMHFAFSHSTLRGDVEVDGFAGEGDADLAREEASFVTTVRSNFGGKRTQVTVPSLTRHLQWWARPSRAVPGQALPPTPWATTGATLVSFSVGHLTPPTTFLRCLRAAAVDVVDAGRDAAGRRTLRARVSEDEYTLAAPTPLRKLTFNLVGRVLESGDFTIDVVVDARGRAESVTARYSSRGLTTTAVSRFSRLGEPVRVTFPPASETTRYATVGEITRIYLP